MSKFRKAVAPLVLGLVAVPIQWIATNEFDMAEFRTALAALVTAAVVFVVPNDAA